MKIISNNKPRRLLGWYELTMPEQEDFDSSEYAENCQFFRYQGMVFNLDEFMRLSDDCEESKAGWHGVYGLNAFCGVLVKLLDNDRVIVGKVLC